MLSSVLGILSKKLRTPRALVVGVSVCASTYDAESIIGKYPLIRKYNPKVYYTCSCREIRIMITVNKDQLLAFYKDVGKPIIIDASDDPEDHNMLTLTIYDD